MSITILLFLIASDNFSSCFLHLHLHRNKCPLTVVKPNKIKHFSGNVMKIGAPFLDRLTAFSDFVAKCKIKVDVLKSLDKDALKIAKTPALPYAHHQTIGYGLSVQLLDTKGVPICDDACLNSPERANSRSEYKCFRDAVFYIGLRLHGNVLYHDFYDIEDQLFANHTARITKIC